jgi:hypothetical protein
MELQDFEGSCNVSTADELLLRLRRVRRGDDGAFVLSHVGKSSLLVHIHGNAAFLGYFPTESGEHPGFVPDGMWPGGHHDVRFLLVNGDEASSITVPWWQLVPSDVAYQAAVEFLDSPILPPSVTWFEL